MVMMRERVVLARLVALPAQPIAFQFQTHGMRIVAIGATDALGVHLALQE
jgi:hypothetical protein